MITQRTGKWTTQQAVALGAESTPLINLVESHPDLMDVLHDAAVNFRMHDTRAVKGLGEPLVRVKQFESSPGLWALDDEDSGVIFLIWSDGYKKKPWKGTSVEIVAKPEQRKGLGLAYLRLVEYVTALMPPDPEFDAFIKAISNRKILSQARRSTL